jgi:hypothetical protein
MILLCDVSSRNTTVVNSALNINAHIKNPKGMVSELYGGFIFCVYVMYMYRKWKTILQAIDKWSNFESVAMKIIKLCVGSQLHWKFILCCSLEFSDSTQDYIGGCRIYVLPWTL